MTTPTDATLGGTTRSYARTSAQAFPSERARWFEGPEPKPGNFWDRCNWWQKALVILTALVACCFVGGMVAGVLTGYGK